MIFFSENLSALNIMAEILREGEHESDGIPPAVPQCQKQHEFIPAMKVVLDKLLKGSSYNCINKKLSEIGSKT